MFGDDFFNDLNRMFGLGEDIPEGEYTYETRGPGGVKVVRRGGTSNIYKQYLLENFTIGKKIYYIFDMKDKKKVTAEISDKIVKNNYNENVATGSKVLRIKEKGNIAFEIQLPHNLKKRGIKQSFNNGILEVVIENE